MTSPFPQRRGLVEMMTYFLEKKLASGCTCMRCLGCAYGLEINTRHRMYPLFSVFITLQYKISTSTVWYKKVRTNQEAKTTKFEEGPDWWPTLKKIFLQSLNLLAIFLLNTLVPCQYWKMSITLSLNRAFTTLRVLNYFLPKTLPETNREFTPENKA